LTGEHDNHHCTKSYVMKTKSTLVKIVFSFILLAAVTNSLHAQRNRHYDSWRYYPYSGQHFLSIPGPYISLQFGGNPYYYSSGLFYRPYGNYFEVAPPPFGIHINVLPRGYWPLNWGGYPYYYYNGIFYRRDNNDYEVVQAPVGASVPALPRDARPVVIDGEKFYEYNGSYFKDYIKPNGELWYTVEGKHGVLNTDRNNTASNNNDPLPQQQPQPQSRQSLTTPQTQTQAQTNNSKPAIGDVFDTLPNDYKTVVINSKKYFVTADNVYYEEVIDGKQVRYKVAGK